MNFTEHFTDLDKLNLVMVFWFQAQAHFLKLPKLPQKILLFSKVIKNDSKVTISHCYSKFARHSAEVTVLS